MNFNEISIKLNTIELEIDRMEKSEALPPSIVARIRGEIDSVQSALTLGRETIDAKDFDAATQRLSQVISRIASKTFPIKHHETEASPANFSVGAKIDIPLTMGAAMFASRYIAGGTLEGGGSGMNSWNFLSLMKKLKENLETKTKGLDTLIEKLENFLQIYSEILSDPTRISPTQLKNIREGSLVFCPLTVWFPEEVGGHAMALSISLQGFKIYNTGAGLDRHASSFIGKRQVFAHTLEYKFPSPEVIWDSTRLSGLNEAFETLLLKVNQWISDYEKASVDTVYDFIEETMHRVGATREQIADEPVSFGIPQPSGVCATQIFYPIFRELIAKEDYHRFSFDWRLLALENLASNFEANPNDSNLQMVLLEGARKLGGRLIKLWPNLNTLSPNKRNKVEALCDRLQAIEDKVLAAQKTSQKLEQAELRLPLPSSRGVKSASLNILCNNKPIEEPVTREATALAFPQDPVFELDKLEGMKAMITFRELQAKQAMERGDKQEAMWQAWTACTYLPGPVDMLEWDGFRDADEMEAFTKQLHFLAEVLSKCAVELAFVGGKSGLLAKSNDNLRFLLTKVFCVMYVVVKPHIYLNESRSELLLDHIDLTIAVPPYNNGCSKINRGVQDQLETTKNIIKASKRTEGQYYFHKDEVYTTVKRAYYKNSEIIGGTMPVPVQLLFETGKATFGFSSYFPFRSSTFQFYNDSETIFHGYFGKPDVDNTHFHLIIAKELEEIGKDEPYQRTLRLVLPQTHQTHMGVESWVKACLRNTSYLFQLESDPDQQTGLLKLLVEENRLDLQGEAAAELWKAVLDLADLACKHAQDYPVNVANLLYFCELRERVLAISLERDFTPKNSLSVLSQRNYWIAVLKKLVGTDSKLSPKEQTAVHLQLLCMEEREEWKSVCEQNEMRKLTWIKRVLPAIQYLDQHNPGKKILRALYLNVEGAWRTQAARSLLQKLFEEESAGVRYGEGLNDCVSQQIGKNFSGAWTMQSKNLWKSGNYMVNVTNGCVYLDGSPLGVLPKSVIASCDPPWSFGEEPLSVRVISPDGCYEWELESKRYRLQKREGSQAYELMMYRGGERGWMRYSLLSEGERSVLNEVDHLLAHSNTYLAAHSNTYLAWKSEIGTLFTDWSMDTQLEIVQPAPGEEAQILALTPSGARTDWSLNLEYKKSKENQVIGFEDPKYMRHWIKADGSHALDFTRYKEMMWHQQQDGRWTNTIGGIEVELITRKEDLPQLDTQFPHFLIIREVSAPQNIRVLMPHGKFEKTEDKNLNCFPGRADRKPLKWSDEAEIYRNDIGWRNYALLSLDDKGELHADSVEGRLQLMTIYFAEGRFERCLELLQECKQDRFLSTEALIQCKKLLWDLFKAGEDNSPQAASTRLHIYHWLRNLLAPPLDITGYQEEQKKWEQKSSWISDPGYRRTQEIEACTFLFKMPGVAQLFDEEICTAAATANFLGNPISIAVPINQSLQIYINTLRYQNPPFALSLEQIDKFGLNEVLGSIDEEETLLQTPTNIAYDTRFVPHFHSAKVKTAFYQEILMKIFAGSGVLTTAFLHYYNNLTNPKTSAIQKRGIIQALSKLPVPQRSSPQRALYLILHYVASLSDPDSRSAELYNPNRHPESHPDPFIRAAFFKLPVGILDQPSNQFSYCLQSDGRSVNLIVNQNGKHSVPLKKTDDGYYFEFNGTFGPFSSPEELKNWMQMKAGIQKEAALNPREPPPLPKNIQHMDIDALNEFFSQGFFQDFCFPQESLNTIGITDAFQPDRLISGRHKPSSRPPVLYQPHRRNNLIPLQGITADPLPNWEEQDLERDLGIKNFSFKHPMKPFLSVESYLRIMEKGEVDSVEDEGLFEISDTSDDPFIVSELVKTQEEIKIGQKINAASRAHEMHVSNLLTESVLKPGQIENWCANLERRKLNDQIEIECLQMGILQLSTEIEDVNIHLEAKRQKIAGARPPLNFANLRALYLRNNTSLWLARTGLSQDKVKEIDRKMTQLFTLQSEVKQLERVLQAARKWNATSDKNDLEAKQALLHLAEECSLSRAYTMNTPFARAFLIFESIEDDNNFLLREDQIGLINRLITEDNPEQFTSRIEKMIMGGGKSKVLLPLLSLLRANGSNLVINTVPRSLYATNLDDLSEVSLRLFGQHARTLRFDPEYRYTPWALEAILSNLEWAISNRDYIVIDDSTLANLELTFIQWGLSLANSTVARPDLQTKLKFLCCILHLISKQGVNLIDEVQIALNVQRKVIIPTGVPIPVKNLRISAHMSVFSELDQISLETGKRVGHDNSGSFFVLCKEKRLFNPEPEVMDKIRNNLAHQLVQKEYTSSDYKGAEHRFTLGDFLDLTSTKNDLVDYLMGKQTEGAARAKTCFDKLHELPKDTIEYQATQILGILHASIGPQLEYLLGRVVGENYGLSEEHPELAVPIPYRYAGKPEEGSEYLPDESLASAAILYRSQPIRTTQIKQYLKAIIKNGEGEAALNPSLSLKETAAVHAFEQRFKCDPRVALLEGLEAFKTQFNEAKQHDPTIIDDFLLLVVGPQVKQFPGKTSSSAANQYAMCKKGSAMSGTPDDTYHQDLLSDPLKGIDGITMDHMLRKAGSLIEIPTIDRLQKNQVSSLLKRFHEGHRDIPLNALIDVGAEFKEQSCRETAQEIMSYYKVNPDHPIKGVLFFNDKSGKLTAVLLNGKEITIDGSDPKKIEALTGLKPENLFTFYDQSHCTGADVKQADRAEALITIGQNSTLPFILQGAMRMRGLRGDQQLHYAIPEQLMMKLPSPSVQAIFKHGAINDAEQRGGEHWKSAQDQITNVPRRALLDAIISSPTVRDVVVRISAARDFLSQQEQEDHYLQMQAPHAAQDPRMILEKQKAAIEKQLETTLKKGFEGEEQKIQEQIQRGWSNVMSILFPEGKSSKLPSRVEAELEELGSSIQIKATQKQELELEEEQVARSINKTRELVSLSFKVKDCSPDQYKACPIEHEGDYMNWRWRSLFKWENCLQLTERFTKRFTTPEPDSPLVPMTHLRVVYESGTPQLIALHAYEIDYLMTFETDTSTSPIHLIDLSGSSRVKIGPVPELSGPQRIQFEDQLQQAQLMQGELLALMKKEKPSPWLQQLGKEKPAELLAFLQEWVRPQFPIATEVLQAFMKWVR